MRVQVPSHSCGSIDDWHERISMHDINTVFSGKMLVMFEEVKFKVAHNVARILCHFLKIECIVLLKSYYGDVMMGEIASQIISLTIVYSAVYSDGDQRKHQSSASLAFVRGIHRGPVNSPHKWPLTRKMLPFDDVIMHNVTIWRSVNNTNYVSLRIKMKLSKYTFNMIINYVKFSELSTRIFFCCIHRHAASPPHSRG